MYSLISCPTFISAQTLNQRTSNRVLVHRTKPESHLHEFSFHDELFVESYDLPESLMSQGAIIVGCCHGLVCWRKLQETFLIWNPSIRKSVELPPPSPSSKVGSLLELGFGFDPVSSDYKLLRIVYGECDESNDLVIMVESHIFDLKIGVWRRLSLTMRPGLVEFPYSCTYVNGILHWIGEDYGCTITLLFFNLSSEVFQEMGMPPFGLEPDEYRAKLLPVNGLLSVATLGKHVYRQNWCSVWSMKEYGSVESWNKLFRIELPSVLSWWGSSLVHCSENGEVLMQYRLQRKNVLVLYKPESRETEVLLSTTGDIFGVCCYSESLVLL